MSEKEVSTQNPTRASVFQNMLGRSPSTGIAGRAPTLPQDFNSHRRRMSIGTTGMSGYSGAPGPASPSSAGPGRWARRASVAGSLSSEDSALEECNDLSLPMTSQLGRRLSSGAQALRAARGTVPGSPTGNGNAPPASTRRSYSIKLVPSSPASKGRADGFNFAENFRTRAERASMSASSGAARPSFGPFSAGQHRRTVSSAAGSGTERAAAAAPMNGQAQPRAQPVPAKPAGLTDPIQERILKGDFYMD